jgi:hypothetical protein
VTFTDTHNTRLVKLTHIIYKTIVCILFFIFTTYICLVGIVYGLRFLTWQPVVQIANISNESTQKFHNYEKRLINAFAFMPEKEDNK